MKIGILTLPLHTNYGGILQAYALKSRLENMGHEVWLINTNFNKKSTWKSLKEKVKNLIKPNPKSIEKEKINKLKNQSYLTFTKPFIVQNFKNITKTFSNPKTISKEIIIYNFDAYIVGSDQIWNPKYFKHIEIAFFSFIETSYPLRISYAPSFGGDIWKFSPEKEKICTDLIKKFNAISVREESAIQLCEKNLGVKPKWVLDPTMLLNIEDYKIFLKNDSTQLRGGLFNYILDKTDEKSKIVDIVATAFDIKPYELETIEKNRQIPLEWGTKATVEKWIENFYISDHIVTDSFHGTVFSILFNKPFFAIINKNRGAARFESLLNAFNLNDRLLGSLEDLTESKLKKKIDWPSVNQILDQKRKESYSFLNDNLLKK
jgi:hypothetical protein